MAVKHCPGNAFYAALRHVKLRIMESSILIREGVMPNPNQSGSNQGGQRQSGENQRGQNQVKPQQHTQHNDRKGQPGSQQGSSGQQSGTNERDRMKDKSGQS
jgi:hypothetical protein